jgi:hypothetical protein
MSTRPVVFAVDVDGVLLKYDGWKGVDHLGDPLPGAKEFLEALRTIGEVMIYTTRTCMWLNKPHHVSTLVVKVQEHLDKHGLPYDTIYSGQGKPPAKFYIDDKGVRCCPQDDPEAFNTTLELIRAALTA